MYAAGEATAGTSRGRRGGTRLAIGGERYARAVLARPGDGAPARYRAPGAQARSINIRMDTCRVSIGVRSTIGSTLGSACRPCLPVPRRGSGGRWWLGGGGGWTEHEQSDFNCTKALTIRQA